MGKVLRSALTSEREVVEPFAMSAEDVFPLNTAPKDKRVPQSNQVKACYMYYNSYHQCKYDFSEDEPQCAKLKHWSMAMCPYEWVRCETPFCHTCLLLRMRVAPLMTVTLRA